jgi:molybdopterin/thiamine biosynthesis adenylyltransferase
VTWYLENLTRWPQERQALEALAAKVDWLTPIRWRIDDELRLIWDADISVGGRVFPVSMRYPDHFPHSPPLVLPRGETERWSSHQYGAGGELCLEFGSDNWHPDITGADMILSAHRLLQGENPKTGARAAVASRHKTTVGQDLRGTRRRLMATPALAEYLAGIPEGVVLTASLVVVFHEEVNIHIVTSVDMPEGEKWLENTLPAPLLYEGYEQSVALFRWPANEPLPSTDSLMAFQAATVQHGLTIPAVKFVLVVRKSRLRAYRISEDNDAVSELSVIPAQPVAARLDESHAALAARKVAIVGCGSLGSKLAVIFARCGVGKFFLIDDDLLFPENFVRHDLDWREAGTHKVDSVARKISLVNAGATCQKRNHRLGGQESSGSVESLIEGLADCDLIVDATAEASVFNFLCATVAFAKKPLLWAEIFGGGFGGLIARYRPLFEPDPASMRRAIENWCLEKGKPIERPVIDYGGGGGSPLIADDADVTVIASHAARMGIDMLIPRSPSMFPNSVYMIGLAKGWIFEQPFETHPIEVGPPVASDSTPQIDPEVAKEEILKIFQLYTEHKDAASSAAKDTQAPTA